MYPPCDTATLSKLPLQPRQRIVVSLSQFRPEKNQALQIRALRLLLTEQPRLRVCITTSHHVTSHHITSHHITSPLQGTVKLVLAGGCRNAEDQARVAELTELRDSLGLTDVCPSHTCSRAQC